MATGRTLSVSQQTLTIYDRLLDRFMPPSFLVDDNGQLVDSFGGAEALLKVKSRRPSQNLLDMLSDELRTAIAGIMNRVRRDTESVRFPGVAVPGQENRFSLIAEPLRDAHGSLTHVLISLADAQAGAVGALVPPFADVPAPRVLQEAADAGAALSNLTEEQIRALEEELTYTKEHLQAAVQEHEAANEELQATNEELIASNEELQSTNEELHSVNEELYTVNAEYQKKNIELQELHDDVEHLLNGTEVATIFLDRQLCIRKFTPRIAETFRVIPQDIGRPLRTFTHDLSHATLVADIERVLGDGVAVEAQAWDKRGRCYFLRILPYRARNRDRSDTKPDGVVLTLTDISAFEQARQKVAQLSAIVESSDDAIIGKSFDGIITSWNNGAYRLYGYTAEEAIGRHASFLAPPGLKDQLDPILRQVREGRAVEHLETRRLRKDGSPVDVSVTYSPIIDASKAIVGVSAISRDITQLVRARQEIAEREEHIRLLLDSTAEAVYGIDLSGVCTFCNSSCARLLGYDSPAALIGRQMHPLIHHTRPDATPYPPEQSPIYHAMRNREGTHVDNEVLWRADGSSFPAEYWSHPIIRNGDVIGAVVTFLDITERRQAEEEVLEGVRRREQFLAMLSHELRNPLAAILSATTLLDNTSWPDEACREAAKVVERQAKHMARLLDDLLDVARITRGRIVLRNERLDLRDTARSAVESLGPFLAEHGTRLTVDLDEQPIPVFGDPARLQQIQANLLSNASKYSPPGAEVRLEVRCEGAHALIRVTDAGYGIERDVLPRIFDLFVQGRQSLERREGGLGIGLTLLKSLVTLHNGTVDARSDGPGLGSVFTVRIPLAAASAGADQRHGTVRPPVTTVVLVEDQADARRMLQLFLENEGIRVYAADNGVDGLELIERLQPDLALVDIGLPVMSGFDLARRIRRNKDNTRIWLVALSGYGQDSDIQAALEAGFDEHLTKPPDHARLQQLLAGTDDRTVYLPME
jgi:two-component system CheB/CheR fusion protein